jgi:hypothetical protein
MTFTSSPLVAPVESLTLLALTVNWYCVSAVSPP